MLRVRGGAVKLKFKFMKFMKFKFMKFKFIVNE